MLPGCPLWAPPPSKNRLVFSLRTESVKNKKPQFSIHCPAVFHAFPSFVHAFPFSFPLSGSHVLPVHFPCISVSLQCPLHFRAIPLTSIFQTFPIHFHSPVPSFPHTSLNGVDSTPCIDCIIRSNVRHGCSIAAPCCSPFSIHSINAFSRNFPSIVHTFSIHPLSLHFPHFFTNAPSFPSIVHPFSSPFHPAISHELFIRIPFPFRSRCPVPFTFCPCIFLHLGFSPVPSSFSCNSFDFQSLLFPCISPFSPLFRIASTHSIIRIIRDDAGNAGGVVQY